MEMKRFAAFGAAVLIAGTSAAATVTSPNGQIAVTVSADTVTAICPLGEVTVAVAVAAAAAPAIRTAAPSAANLFISIQLLLFLFHSPCRR